MSDAVLSELYERFISLGISILVGGFISFCLLVIVLYLDDE